MIGFMGISSSVSGWYVNKWLVGAGHLDFTPRQARGPLDDLSGSGTWVKEVILCHKQVDIGIGLWLSTLL